MKQTTLSIVLFAILIFISSCSHYKIITPVQDSYNLTTLSSTTGRPITITENTPALEYNKRIYYFDTREELNQFKNMPDLFILKYNFNEIPKPVPPLESDFGLRTQCSYNGDSIVVGPFSPALMYMDRIYYFAHPQSRDIFAHDPQLFVAKYPINQVPKAISPLRSQYGTQVTCGTTGETILVGPHTPALEFMGRIFYFNSIESMELFRKDPQFYIAKPFNKENTLN